MARSDLLINLVKAGVAGDRALLRSTTEAIIAEEKAKQHGPLAERLTQALNGLASQPLQPGGLDRTVSRARDMIIEVQPKRRIEELVLTPEVSTACRRLIDEQQRSSLLRAKGLEPRHRVLLVGPPGNGKTTLAEAIAFELALSLFVVRYDAIIGSYLGETASRLRRVMDYARTTACVLFFDEFDAIGKERGDIHETGEIKRVVTSLLMQIDDLPSYTVVVAATNHSELLDRAVWRRFQLRLNLPPPDHTALSQFLQRFIETLDQPVRFTGRQLASKLNRISYAEASEFCIDILRGITLRAPESTPDQVIQDEIRLWVSRSEVVAESLEEPTRARKTSAKAARTKHSKKG